MPAEFTGAPFTIVVPVKGGPDAKSRLDDPDRAALALAMALDTVEAALAVAPVIVVAPPSLFAGFAALGAVVLPDPGAGLIAAIESGLAAVPASRGSAVLLGDVPGVQPVELAAALAAATERVMVADADGVGTVLIAAPPGVTHQPGFGAGSRALHRASGYRELLEPWPGLRRDVDVAANLEGLAAGPRTTALRR